MILKLLYAVSFAFALFSSISIAQADDSAYTSPSGIVFQERSVKTSTGLHKFLVYVPAHLNPADPPPVMLFLHGSGERGDDNTAQVKNGICLLIAQNVDAFPCVVVCPQCEEHESWTRSDMTEMALAALDQEVKEFHGDSKRLYLTGLSMGGFGTWDLAYLYPDKWAAIAPCCGAIMFHDKPVIDLGNPPSAETLADPYLAVARTIVKLPVWAFHGDADGTVPVIESRQMVALLLSVHAEVRYSEYQGVGHDSWNHAYKEPDLLYWFLSHHRD